MFIKKIFPTPYHIAFYIGVIFGLLLTGIASWADLEAASYGFDRTGGEMLSALDCPIIMTANETNSIAVNITNATDGKLSPSAKSFITASWKAPVFSYQTITLAPGESKQVEWAVGPENLDLKYFILAYVRVYGYYPLPARENTCGIFVVNLPTNGAVITWTMVIISLLGVGVGLYGMTKLSGIAPSPMVMLRIQLLAFLVAAGIISSYMGWWIPGVLVIVTSVLLTAVSVFVVKS